MLSSASFFLFLKCKKIYSQEDTFKNMLARAPKRATSKFSRLRAKEKLDFTNYKLQALLRNLKMRALLSPRLRVHIEKSIELLKISVDSRYVPRRRRLGEAHHQELVKLLVIVVVIFLDLVLVLVLVIVGVVATRNS